jgi:hypothetical protein
MSRSGVRFPEAAPPLTWENTLRLRVQPTRVVRNVVRVELQCVHVRTLCAATGASAAASRNCAAVHCGSLSNGSIRYIHFIISGALKRAVRWRWIATNPIAQAAPPPQPKPNPQPPTTAQAVRILNEAWQDPDWAMLVWLTMVTGFRRGELCAIPVAPRRSRRWCADGGAEHRPAQRTDLGEDTKTHQHRRIALDPKRFPCSAIIGPGAASVR